MKGLPRNREITDNMAETSNRVRQLELSGKPVGFGPKPWEPAYDDDVVAEFYMSFGAWTPDDHGVGLEAQQLRAAAAGMNGVQVKALGRVLQMVGAMPAQNHFAPLTHNGSDRQFVRWGGTRVLGLGRDYATWKGDDDARIAPFSGPYPPDGGTWVWRDAGQFIDFGANTDPSLPDKVVPEGRPIPRVFGPDEAPWEDQFPENQWAVPAGGYLYTKPGSGQTAYRDSWGSASFRQGSSGPFFPCRTSNSQEVGVQPGGKSITFQSDAPLCFSDGAGHNNADGGVEAGAMVMTAYFVEGADIGLSAPPAYDDQSVYTEAMSGIDQWYNDVVLGTVAQWPGFAWFRDRVAMAVDTEDGATVATWMLGQKYDWAADSAHWGWQTAKPLVPWLGRPEFRVHDRRCYLRGSIINRFAWSSAPLFILPPWIVPAHGIANPYRPFIPATITNVDGSDPIPAYLRVNRTIDNSSFAVFAATSEFGQTEEHKVVVLDGASFVVNP